MIDSRPIGDLSGGRLTDLALTLNVPNVLLGRGVSDAVAVVLRVGRADGVCRAEMNFFCSLIFGKYKSCMRSHARPALTGTQQHTHATHKSLNYERITIAVRAA